MKNQIYLSTMVAESPHTVNDVTKSMVKLTEALLTRPNTTVTELQRTIHPLGFTLRPNGEGMLLLDSTITMYRGDDYWITTKYEIGKYPYPLNPSEEFIALAHALGNFRVDEHLPKVKLNVLTKLKHHLPLLAGGGTNHIEGLRRVPNGFEINNVVFLGHRQGFATLFKRGREWIVLHSEVLGLTQEQFNAIADFVSEMEVEETIADGSPVPIKSDFINHINDGVASDIDYSLIP